MLVQQQVPRTSHLQRLGLEYYRISLQWLGLEHQRDHLRRELESKINEKGTNKSIE